MTALEHRVLWHDEGWDPGRKHHLEGTHRTCSPANTVTRVRSIMDRLGITRVANVTGLDRIGIPVVMNTHSFLMGTAARSGGR